MSAVSEVKVTINIKENLSAGIEALIKKEDKLKKKTLDTEKALKTVFEKKYSLMLETKVKSIEVIKVRKELEKKFKNIKMSISASSTKVSVSNSTSEASGKSPKASGSMLGFVKAGFAGLAGIAAQGISEAVKSGAVLEQESLHMDQAIAASNPQMGTAEVKKQRDGYMKQLRDSAAGTGMDSSDVISAGTKAVGVTGGDTAAAMELVKVAQDMAAMNPGKSVADAMDALAAAKGGDTAGLKEFNANFSAEDVKNNGFMGAVQKKLKPQFAGGAEQFSGTGAGLVSVIKGKLNNKLQDMGLGIIEKLKPALESVVMLIDRYGPTLDAFGQGIASGIGLAINCVQAIAGLIGEKFSWIGEKTGFLQQVFQVGWEGIKSIMATAWEFIQPVMSLIANGAMLLFNIFQWAFPGIQAVIENVWAFIKPIFENLGGAIGWIADGVGKVAEWIGGKKTGKGDEAPAKGMPAIAARPETLPKAPAMINSSLQNGTGGMNSGLNSFAAPSANMQECKPCTQNQTFNININGVNKSTNEIMNELIPKLKLALSNTSSGAPGKVRYGGALA